MSYYFKLVVIASSLMLTASALTDARYEIINEGKLAEGVAEAEIKALAALKEVENLVIAEEHCFPSGRYCSPIGPPGQCCSGSCVPHPYLRVFVCA